MKFVQTFPLSTILLVGFGTSGANGYVYSSGSLPRSSCKPGTRRSDCSTGDAQNFAPFPRNGRYRQGNDRVDQAFRDLQDEIGGIKGDGVDGQLNWVTMGSTPYPFEKFDEEGAKKWLGKAFDLASEFNKDFAATTKEQETTDEMIQKSRGWVARLYKDHEIEATNDGDDPLVNQADSPISPEQKPKDPKSATHGPNSPSLKTKQEEVLSEIPNSENRSNEEMFQVAVDLPGVKRDDVDVTLDGDFLVIAATRNAGSTDQPVRNYRKKIAFLENEVHMDKMEASLKNGVLLISVPKNKPTEKKRKILIT